MMMIINKLMILLLLLFSLSACSQEQELPEKYVTSKKHFEEIALFLVDNFSELEKTDSCNKEVNGKISFSKESFGKCFSGASEVNIQKISDFLSKDLAMYVFVTANNVRFQVAVDSDIFITTFKNIIYSKDDTRPKEEYRESVTKIKKHWYLFTTIQDTW